MELPAAYQQLVNALDQLPAIGPKAAARLAQHLLNGQPESLLHALTRATHEVVRCVQCQTFSATERCACCSNETRNRHEVLIVETIDDQLQAETNGWQGLYFVLHGLLSPMAGRGPRQLGLSKLQQLVKSMPIERVLMLLESSAEGKATFQFIASLPELSDKLVEPMVWSEWVSQQESR